MKLDDYQKAGVLLIWVVNLKSRTVMVYRSDGSVNRLRESDELSGEDVIPGFRCPVKEIFPRRDRWPRLPRQARPDRTGPNHEHLRPGDAIAGPDSILLPQFHMEEPPRQLKIVPVHPPAGDGDAVA